MTTASYNTEGSFLGYDLGDLRSLVLRMLRVTDTTRFSPSSTGSDYTWIDDSINRGQDDFVGMTKCLSSYAIVELQSGQRVYRLPDDFLDASAVYFYTSAETYGYRKLIVNSIDQMNDDIAGWRTITGTPERFYPERNYGQGKTFGLYPIPNTDGDSTIFNQDNGVVVQYNCPLYAFSSDTGCVIRFTGTDEFIMSSSLGEVVDASATEGNLLIEYTRLPLELTTQNSGVDIQKTEIPKESQKALCYYAAFDLLSMNPEDSAEFKRSQYFKQLYDQEISKYINKRKRPMTAQLLRAKPAVWNYQQNMTYYKEMP
jgi:hypothetical protein